MNFTFSWTSTCEGEKLNLLSAAVINKNHSIFENYVNEATNWIYLSFLSPYQIDCKVIFTNGGTVAEWSKALLKREKINENQKIPGSPPPAWAPLKKGYIYNSSLHLVVRKWYHGTRFMILVFHQSTRLCLSYSAAKVLWDLFKRL